MHVGGSRLLWYPDRPRPLAVHLMISACAFLGLTDGLGAESAQSRRTGERVAPISHAAMARQLSLPFSVHCLPTQRDTFLIELPLPLGGDRPTQPGMAAASAEPD